MKHSGTRKLRVFSKILNVYKRNVCQHTKQFTDKKSKVFLLALGCALILSSVLLGLFTGTQVNSDLVERIKLDQSTSAIELSSEAPKVISALAPQHDVPLQAVTGVITESAVANTLTDAEPLNLKVLDLHTPAEDTDTDRQNN